MSRTNPALGPDAPSPEEWEARQLEANALPAKWEGTDYLKRQVESTSAQLRRVEQERDELRNKLLHAQALGGDVLQKCVEALKRAELAEAELASARTELTHLRRERDQLRTDLTEALDELQRLHAPRPTRVPHCPVVDDLCPGDSRGVLCLTSCGGTS